MAESEHEEAERVDTLELVAKIAPKLRSLRESGSGMGSGRDPDEWTIQWTLIQLNWMIHGGGPDADHVRRVLER